jgi:RimJ/RimL family protein N-acetyltransferase
MTLADWTARPRPGKAALTGQYCRLEPLDWAAHKEGLFDAICGEGREGLWTYMAFHPFPDADALAAGFEAARRKSGLETLVIRSLHSGKVLGMGSYMNIAEANGSAEIGSIVFGPELQRSREATEFVYLTAVHLFDDLGYRRYEWKCDNKNEPSKRAALRFGFIPEGVFRKHMVVKGLNRDTAWFAMTDDDWARCKPAYQAWLSPANFDESGQQRQRLTLRAAA